MKYVEYILLLTWHLLSKVIGLVWFFVVLPFRHYARNVVYNYVLQNDIYLKRLLERPVYNFVLADRYIINPFHGTDGGHIKYRRISKIEYYLVFWVIWGFLDDDANEDTYSWGHMERNYPWWTKGKTKPQYGNTFDLGDAREPSFDLIAALVWNTRNTAENFLYMHFQKQTQPFLHIWFGRQFGWGVAPDGVGYQLYYGKKL